MINKQDIARSFGRVAHCYDQFAHFQQQVGRHLLTLLPEGKCRRVIDLGCGTGYFCQPLRSRYPGSEYVGIDLAEAMVHRAGRLHQANLAGFVVGDMEALPLNNASCDRIYINLALQWSRNLPQTLAELRRVVTDNGVIAIATLGPQTLIELRQAWGQVDRKVHVNDFVAKTRLLSLVEQAGFDWHCEEIIEELQYSQILDLMRDLKGIGAHNLNQGRALGLTGKGRLTRLQQSYEGYRLDNGMLPARYQLYYLVLSPAR